MSAETVALHVGALCVLAFIVGVAVIATRAERVRVLKRSK
jgi:hypothetical protein